jgi:hypothetical protein
MQNAIVLIDKDSGDRVCYLDAQSAAFLKPFIENCNEQCFFFARLSMCDSSHVREGFPLHIVVTTGDSTDALEIIAKKLHDIVELSMKLSWKISRNMYKCLRFIWCTISLYYLASYIL